MFDHGHLGGRTMLLCLVLLSGFQDAPEETPHNPATVEAVRDIFQTLWTAPPDRVTKLGGNLLNRYRKRKADMGEVQYAYGLVLAHRGVWDAAEVNLRAAAAKYGNNPIVHLALAQAHLRLGKIKEGMDDIRHALRADPTWDPAIESAGIVVAFFEAKPPTKLKAEEVRKLEDDVLAKLANEQVEVYKAAKARVSRYVEALPQLRQKMMEPVQSLQMEADKARKSAREQQAKLATLQAELVRRQALIASTDAASAADINRLERAALRARRQGDLARAASYEAEAFAVRASADATIAAEQARLEQIQIQGQALESELAETVQLAERLAAEAAGAIAAIDAQLATPPSDWDATEERDRLLREGSLQGQTVKRKKENREPKEYSDDDRASALLQVADSLRASGRPELARRYLERVVAEYPHSKSAEDARWELDHWNEGNNKKRTSPPNAKRDKP